MNKFVLLLSLTILACMGLADGASVGGKIAPDGKNEIMVDLPDSQQMKNTGGSDGPRGPGSGSGLCVFTSIMHGARWQHVTALENFQKWMTNHPGGGYPDKVTKMVAQICKEQGVPVPQLIQVEGGRETLAVLQAALQSGRMPGVTYSFSPSGRYNRQRIAHMVNLVYLDDKYACILDNNYIGEKNLEWITTAEFLQTFTGNGKSGWAVILLDSAPPPLPYS